jgi:hypothetical protein
MGEERPAGEWWMRAHLPAPGELRLLRDGEVVAMREGTEIEHPATAAGVYRIEARREFRGRLRPWIYSNPIYLR